MFVRPLPIQDDILAHQLLMLQRAAYQIEAQLIGSDAIPPLTETLDALRQCGETFYGYWRADRLTGAISYKRTGSTLDIYRLIVHPTAFRQGIGRTLLHFVENVEKNLERLIVSTGRDNLPACRLYLSEGFVRLNDEEVAPGLFITHFEKRLVP